LKELVNQIILQEMKNLKEAKPDTSEFWNNDLPSREEQISKIGNISISYNDYDKAIIIVDNKTNYDVVFSIEDKSLVINALRRLSSNVGKKDWQVIDTDDGDVFIQSKINDKTITISGEDESKSFNLSVENTKKLISILTSFNKK